MFNLKSVPRETGGLVTTWGEFTTVRDCTVAARLLAGQIKNPHIKFTAVEVDGDDPFGREIPILLSPGEHRADTEIVLSDGQIVWLGEVDQILREYATERKGKR